MAHMEFTMLSTELRRDPRWRRLKGHEMARLTFLSLFPSSLIDYSGYLHLPLEIFTYESMISRNDALQAFHVLKAGGLIEYDEATEFLRIIGWFSQRQIPCNSKHLQSVLKSYRQPHIPNDIMTARSLAELSVAALIRSQRFLSDTDKSRMHKGTYVGILCKFLEDSISKIPELPSALAAEFQRAEPEYRAFFEEIVLMVPGLEKCGAALQDDFASLNGSVTVQEPLPDHRGTVSIRYPEGLDTVSRGSRYRIETVGQPSLNRSGRIRI